MALFTDKKWFSVNGRFTYTGTRAGLRFGTERLPAGGRPNLGASASCTMGTGQSSGGHRQPDFSLFPTSKLTFTNSTAVYNVRTDGNSEFLQLNNGTGQFVTQDFQYLGIRTIANQTDLNYQGAEVARRSSADIIFGPFHPQHSRSEPADVRSDQHPERGRVRRENPAACSR